MPRAAALALSTFFWVVTDCRGARYIKKLSQLPEPEMLSFAAREPDQGLVCLSQIWNYALACNDVIEGPSMEPIKLTQTVQKGGCAAKVSAAALRGILAKVKFPPAHPELSVDGRHFDDAAVYRLPADADGPSLSMVQTLDFFTPILDSPRLFGRVAACNALSDVYAMGGKPKTAMAILAYPVATFADETIQEVLQGACDMLAEANCCFVGGHSIDDDTLKFGLSVTGFVRSDRVWANTGAKEGDILILTKKLGTGTLAAALKRQAVTEQEMSEAIASMTTLNNAIDYLTPDQLLAIHAATDVTGFGLSGHAYQMAKASDQTFVFDISALPVFADVQNLLEQGFLTKAHRTNREYTSSSLRIAAVADWINLIIHDPQTSGGLLLAVDGSRAREILQQLRKPFPAAAIIGRVAAKTDSSSIIFE